jgi:RNA polymerase sigma factor for flagellar operon FliA
MPTSLNALIEAHVPLVRAIAAQVQRRTGHRIPVTDLIGHGSEALVDAARRYEVRHGAQFSTFAHWRVRGAMLDEARRTLRAAPGATLESVANLATNTDDAEQQIGRAQVARRLPAAIARLAPRERAFIRAHYVDGKSILEVGAELGLSKSWASRVHARAIARLAELLGVE